MEKFEFKPTTQTFENDIFIHIETGEEYRFKGVDDSFPKKHTKMFLQKVGEKEIKSHEDRFFKKKD